MLDDQITYVTIELDKFLKTADEVTDDLDKLLYTMKTVHTVTEPTQYPQFWTEEWLKKAIDELDKRKLTPDERFAYERTLAINAESIRVTNKIIKDGIEEGVREGIQKAVQEAVQDVRQEAVQERNKSIVERMLRQGKLSIDEIADTLAISPDFIRSIQTELGL